VAWAGHRLFKLPAFRLANLPTNKRGIISNAYSRLDVSKEMAFIAHCQ
jgi:hypothetical protein